MTIYKDITKQQPSFVATDAFLVLGKKVIQRSLDCILNKSFRTVIVLKCQRDLTNSAMQIYYVRGNGKISEWDNGN